MHRSAIRAGHAGHRQDGFERGLQWADVTMDLSEQYSGADRQGRRHPVGSSAQHGVYDAISDQRHRGNAVVPVAALPGGHGVLTFPGELDGSDDSAVNCNWRMSGDDCLSCVATKWPMISTLASAGRRARSRTAR
jgi:hypothetical protein